ncbi:lysoplasmalogenase [Microbacterium sp. BK668]|uniref:lysoplasmalogenase n=1 Tax=Microbacterium sp. BK668 TaxID=2512118 RepID=UPI0010EAF9F7|nr:lysoplasmalogenase [Microbacterium sp. BK668]TDN93254.1 putative membrane protein YhhN [Microbacterium sp. BK668]
MSTLPRARWWWGFALYAGIALLHIGALALGARDAAAATKLLLMPLLALAVLWAGRGSRWGTTYTVLFLALAFSWLGDGAATFFPTAPELPVMLLCFGLAHVCYIWLFWRVLAVRPLPLWSALYGCWWIGLLLVLWPTLEALLIPVALYGLVLAGTAAAASRCHPLIAWGGALFLASDTLLAFRLFTPEAMPGWTSPLVMLTYCLGQGLLAAGVVVADRLRDASERHRAVEAA